MSGVREVLCICKSDRLDPHERITQIGGRNGDGKAWRLTQQEAIAGVESGKWTFYVYQAGNVVPVIVAVSHHGHKYLKTAADGEEPNNLFSLPECR
jgi:hypothetical protein